IRPRDINFDNTISSRFIADAAITLTGEGVIADEQRVGWGSRLLAWIWPF
ncbi:MAG: flagellar basal body L-ring protein FlgH, partial [Nitrospinales bacterium]